MICFSSRPYVFSEPVNILLCLLSSFLISVLYGNDFLFYREGQGYLFYLLIPFLVVLHGIIPKEVSLPSCSLQAHWCFQWSVTGLINAAIISFS